MGSRSQQLGRGRSLGVPRGDRPMGCRPANPFPLRCARRVEFMTVPSVAFSREWLAEQGFVGFETVSHLRSTRCASVPKQPGVYTVVRISGGAPSWLDISSGGHFKGRDPTVPVAVLQARFIA